MAWTWDITPAPAVGAKLTAAGFGAQVDGAVAELQAAIDALSGGSATAGATAFNALLLANESARTLREDATPGGLTTGLTGAGVSATVGTTTVVSGPSSGRRVLKSLVVHSPSTGASVVLKFAGNTLATFDFSTAGVAQLDCCLPIANGETIQAVVTGATCYVTPTYKDRTDTLLDRLGYASGSTSGTLISSGSARTISQLWVANNGAAAATATIQIGSAYLLNAVALTSHSVFTIDAPIPVPSSTAVTWAGDSSHSVEILAVGY